jgi:glutamyl-tRNA synthetase
LRKEQEELWLPTKYDRKCRYLSEEEIEKNLSSWVPYVVRLKVPDNKEISFDDVIKWKIKINTKDIDDQVLLKSDWFPTYHLAVVIDDYLMWVTHIIRWDEWISSTPKHILLYEAFWWETPVFAHLPLLLWSDRKKLSKRTGDVSVESYLEKWYLTEAIINYIALLGWNPKTTEEFFSMKELIERFELESVHKAWAVFDIERLKFFNSHYLRTLDLSYLFDKLSIYLSKYDKDFYDKISSFSREYNLKVLEELRTRIKYFSEFKGFSTFFYDEPKIPGEKLLVNEKMKIISLEESKKWLRLALKILENKKWDFSTIEEVKESFIKEIEASGMKNWQVLWPVRCALSGEEFSPWALELIYILWVEEAKKRIKKI